MIDEPSMFSYFIQSITRKYFTIKGRANRKEFWSFVLFNILFSALGGFLVVLFGSFAGNHLDYSAGLPILNSLMAILIIYSLYTIIPNITLSIRSLHDLNITGWGILLFMIPLVNVIMFVILLVIPGSDGKNKYDDNDDLDDLLA